MISFAKKCNLLIALCCLALSVQAEIITILEDDGSGFNPSTQTQNNWIPDDTSVWNIGGTVQELANNQVFNGTQAANDMLAALGANNQVITANVLGAGTNTLSLNPIQFSFMGAQPFELAFSQSVRDDTAVDSMGNQSNTAFIFDNIQMDVESNSMGGFSAWLWMEMYAIKEVLFEIQVAVQRIRFVHKDLSIVTTVIETQVVQAFEFISMGSVHFHADFNPGQNPVRLPSEGLLTTVPEPGVFVLMLTGLVLLLAKRKAN